MTDAERDDYEDYMQTERANEESEVDKEIRHRLLDAVPVVQGRKIRHRLLDAVPAVQRRKRRVTMLEIQEIYDSLDQGAKQHLSNKLWKDDRVCPQKLRMYVPNEVLEKGEV
jgi:hypothetical protein